MPPPDLLIAAFDIPSVAIGVPLLLAIGNAYRSRRWPSGLAAPAAASGTLLTQALVLASLAVPAGIDVSSRQSSLPLLVLLILTTVAGNLAGSVLQKTAGPTAYSQIGYVIALTGVAGRPGAAFTHSASR